jgi:hypothetical protein
MCEKFLTLLLAMSGRGPQGVLDENFSTVRIRYAMSSRTRCFLMAIATLLMITVATADPVSCPGTRCVPMLTGNWRFYAEYTGSEPYPSFDAAMAVVTARINSAYAPCSIEVLPSNNEFQSLLETVVPNGVTQISNDNWTGDDYWSIYQAYGTKYDIRWGYTGVFNGLGT